MQYDESVNDGTIAITQQVKRPAQGTFIGRDDAGRYVLAKGIVRPPLVNLDEKLLVEEEGHVVQAAFGRRLEDTVNGKFFITKEVGKERCSLSYQTILFSLADPAAAIRRDNAKIAKMTALDFVSREARRKIEAGIHPAMLMDDMAPWLLLTRYSTPGVRATAYGSTLVRAPSLADADSAISQALSAAGWEANGPWFKLLPGTAMELGRKMSCKMEDKVGAWFLIHRDPALPDGTSMYPARYGGTLTWLGDDHPDRSYGVVLNPEDPHWKAVGGDFDGDSAAVYAINKDLIPVQGVSRPDYRLDGRVYTRDEIAEQMAEAANDTVTGLLGPIILGAMRLFERGMDGEYWRATTAAVAQASVQAKKHSVDIEAVTEDAGIIFDAVREASHERRYPFISDFVNAVSNASGVEAKLAGWAGLMEEIAHGTWDGGTAIELALVERIRIIDGLFREVSYFQDKSDVNRLPASIASAAKVEASAEATTAVKELMRQYRTLLAEVEANSEVEDTDMREMLSSDARDRLGILREAFSLAVMAGTIGHTKASVRDAQMAVVGYGPNRLAARIIPAEIFEDLGRRVHTIIVNLVGHDWEDGKEYRIGEIVPIPNCLREYTVFAKRTDRCHLEVIHEAGRSTRVMLHTGEAAPNRIGINDINNEVAF